MFKQMIKFPQQEENETVSGGVMGLHDNISPTSRPLAMLSVCKNLRRHGVSAAITRPGRFVVGDKIGSSKILGLSHYYKSGGTKKLLTCSNKSLKVYNPNTEVWDNVKTDLTADKPYDAVTFNDLHIITNGTDNVQAYNGSSITNLEGSPPKGKFISTAYQRVAICGVSGSPHLLYFSDIANPKEWSEGDSAAIPVNDKDGDEITWAQLYKAHWIIWKRYGLFELHGPELGQTTDDWSVVSVAAIGTHSGRTIADVNGILYWLSNSDNFRGVVRWAGGTPALISEPVNNIIASINYSAIDTACAVSSGQGEYVLAIPTGSATNPNVLLVYNVIDNTWWVWDGWMPTIFLQYSDGSTKSLNMGDADGYVYKMGGNTDNGAAIKAEAVFGPSTLGINTKEKRVRKGYVIISCLGEEK